MGPGRQRHRAEIRLQAFQKRHPLKRRKRGTRLRRRPASGFASSYFWYYVLDPYVKNTHYTFQMTLELRSRPLGRWNRLDFQEYESVAVTTGEAVALPLKKERAFWFSKVRSYA